jgi:hypothetical protein
MTRIGNWKRTHLLLGFGLLFGTACHPEPEEAWKVYPNGDTFTVIDPEGRAVDVKDVSFLADENPAPAAAAPDSSAATAAELADPAVEKKLLSACQCVCTAHSCSCSGPCES